MIFYEITLAISNSPGEDQVVQEEPYSEEYELI
jgi:hypothetical protein